MASHDNTMGFYVAYILWYWRNMFKLYYGTMLVTLNLYMIHIGTECSPWYIYASPSVLVIFISNNNRLPEKVSYYLLPCFGHIP